MCSRDHLRLGRRLQAKQLTAFARLAPRKVRSPREEPYAGKQVRRDLRACRRGAEPQLARGVRFNRPFFLCCTRASASARRHVLDLIVVVLDYEDIRRALRRRRIGARGLVVARPAQIDHLSHLKDRRAKFRGRAGPLIIV